MKRKIFVALIVVLALFAAFAASTGLFASDGEKLFREAARLEKRADYFMAFDTYKLANAELKKEKNIALSDKCRDSLTRIKKITLTYSFTEEAMRGIIKKTYPDMPKKRIDEVIAENRIPHTDIGGTIYYFADFLNTLNHLYPDFRRSKEKGALGPAGKFLSIMNKYIYEKESGKKGETLFSPINYYADGSMTLARKKLPASGTLKVWLPLPLVTAAQRNVKIVSIYPEKYIKYPIKLDGDIALVYMEIPLEEIKGDLKIGTKFSFTHYEERFNIDPEKIGEYDKESALYKRYTASAGNIKVTPSIAKKAKELAGGEKNPLRIAKKFYDHIVWDLDYSFSPHAAIEAMEIPESVWVDEHGIGDCGAQSIYFAALCRAVGIPARASGGMQLFPMQPTGCGTHFWAQIYLPNYGWVPVDTSVGQLVKYIDGVTEKQKKDFADYFFTKMEPFRYLIQVDVDIPLIPLPDEPPTFSMVLQDPALTCREMDLSPGIEFMEDWKITVKQVK